MPTACPRCARTVTPGDAFCGECGASLLEDGARSPPRGLPDESGERKQLTVLFADVKGSMDLQQEMDAEAWAAVIGKVVEILSAGIRRYGGTVDAFTGDGVMALFGAPVALDDHARRACHAAFDLLSAVGEYAEDLRRAGGPHLQLRLGLNSGEAIVGPVGEDSQTTVTALGHTVGLAQRMEALAEPGRAYLTEHTARLVEGRFDVSPLGAMAVRGAQGPLRVFALEGPAARPPRPATANAAPLVGRSQELAVLDDALAAAVDGEAQVVGIVGEAGVGKSRLCDEFALRVAGRGITVRRTAGLSHAQEIPLRPILALWRDYFSISEAEPAARARQKVEQRLADLKLDLEALPLVFDFLGVPDPERPAPSLDPEIRMRRIFGALRQLTERRSEREPLVLLTEDLHWFDRHSAAFLERLVESFPGSRTLVVTNFRPEFSASWMRHSYYRQIPLRPLQADAVEHLLDGVLGGDESLAPLRRLIVESTAGNPFFIEEVVRTMVEDGTLVGGPGAYRTTRPVDRVRIPASVQAVLAARIDRLIPQDKRVLQAAAVVGRTFPESVLSQMTALPREELDESLGRLRSAELIHSVRAYPGAEFRFWHPLTQEVAYDALLRARRASLHAAAAGALEEHHAERLDEQAALLAWHWERAGQPLEAARWTLRAGHNLLRGDLREARGRWLAVIDLLEGVHETPESIQFGLVARHRLLQYGARMGIAPEEAERLETDGRRLAQRLDDPVLECRIIMASGAPRLWGGDPRGSLRRFLEAARVSRRAQHPELEAAIWISSANAIASVGPLALGLRWASRVMAVCRDDSDAGLAVLGYRLLPWLLEIRARLYARSGQIARAAGDLTASVERLRQADHPEILAWALAQVATVASLRGEGGSGLEEAATAVKIAEDAGNVASLVLGLEGLAIANLTSGNPTSAAAACQRALAAARRQRSGLFQEPSLLATLARALLESGETDAALDAAEEAVASSRRQGARVFECLALLARMQVKASLGRPGDVRDDAAEARRLARRTGASVYTPFILMAVADAQGDAGLLDEARRLFEEVGAYGHARRLGARLARMGGVHAPAVADTATARTAGEPG